MKQMQNIWNIYMSKYILENLVHGILLKYYVYCKLLKKFHKHVK